jgi:PAS domain S-box-containing protein
MASEAGFGKIIQTRRASSGLWEVVPNLRPDPRKPEKKTRGDSDAAFSALFENRIAGVMMTSLDKRWLRVNDRWCEMTGYSREELLSLDWAQMTHPEDLDADVAQFQRLVSGEIRDYTLQKRFVRKNGDILYAEISAASVRGADGKLKHFVAMAVDTTERNHAEQSLVSMTRKLIEAQEQERARIGRELHDDIGQRLALLALDIDMLRDQNQFTRPRSLGDLRTQVDEITRDIQSLSHDLHAAKLEYLGAVPGIRSWCMDFGARYKIQIVFSSDVRTSLPGAVGICLFRVVQEALQNVVKHSGTNRAEVSFAERGHDVHLVINDMGRGFDTRDVRDGLGLISMRERIRLMGGTLIIESRVMRGTSILVRVPLQRIRKPRGVTGHKIN